MGVAPYPPSSRSATRILPHWFGGGHPALRVGRGLVTRGHLGYLRRGPRPREAEGQRAQPWAQRGWGCVHAAPVRLAFWLQAVDGVHHRPEDPLDLVICPLAAAQRVLLPMILHSAPTLRHSPAPGAPSRGMVRGSVPRTVGSRT